VTDRNPDLVESMLVDSDLVRFETVTISALECIPALPYFLSCSYTDSYCLKVVRQTYIEIYPLINLLELN
jgi:hypothetical protein